MRFSDLYLSALHYLRGKIILPDFICIGAQRAGTTWLYEMLRRHPGMFLPDQKELHFFDEKPDFTNYQGLGNPGQRIYYDMKSRAHWRWYYHQFKNSNEKQIKGEITPYYAVLSEERVALMAEKLLGLKLIYILRNPIQRAWSGFRLFWFLETKHHECNLDADQIYKTIMYPAKLIHGDYSRNIGAYEKYFKSENILYLFYDDILLKPQVVLHQVCEFLGVAELQPAVAEMKQKINTADPMDMPPLVRTALNEYYADQISFIKQKFNRSLEY